MPKGSKVHKLFEQLKGKGYGVKDAAKIAQKKTGLALATGRPPKQKDIKYGKRSKT